MDNLAFYQKVAQENNLGIDEVKNAVEIAIEFLLLRKKIVAMTEEKPKVIGVRVSDTIKAVDRLA